MQATDHRDIPRLGNLFQSEEQILQTLFLVDILSPMDGREQVFLLFDTQLRVNVAPADGCSKGLEHLVDRISRDEDSTSVNSRSDQVFFTAVCVRE